ncbi:MAG: ThiF family adenylyltransferase [Gaiellaceae bacterium]
MLKPRVKNVHNPVRLPDGTIRIGSMQFGIGSEIRTNDNDAVWRVLELMDGTQTAPEIDSVLRQRRPDLEAGTGEDIIDSLVEAGFAEEGAPVETTLSLDAQQRYSRARSFYAWIDTVPRVSPWYAQERLRDASVAVIGLGGAGSAVAVNLVSAGIGKLTCVDCDVVDLSNLNRQLLYSSADVGRSKTLAALERLQLINPECVLEGREQRVESEADIVDLMTDVDLFILCADQPEPRQICAWTNAAALITGTPWLMSFYAGPMVVVGAQQPGITPCYECLRHWAELDGKIDDGRGALDPELRVNAVIGPSASIAGSFAALEAIYLLAGLKPQTLGRIFHQSLTSYDYMYWVDGEVWDDCHACGGGQRMSTRRTEMLGRH